MVFDRCVCISKLSAISFPRRFYNNIFDLLHVTRPTYKEKIKEFKSLKYSLTCLQRPPYGESKHGL